MTSCDDVLIRPACAEDFASIAAIYRPYVLATAITFEVDPPGAEEMQRRWRSSDRVGAPFLVAEARGVVRGYAAARPYAEKAAYAWTLEDSIYLASDARGRGVGRLLLQALIEAAEAAGFRQMVALIAAGASEASVTLHRRAGFRHAGTLKALGYKLGKWHDVIYMQRALGTGAETAPDR